MCNKVCALFLHRLFGICKNLMNLLVMTFFVKIYKLYFLFYIKSAITCDKDNVTTWQKRMDRQSSSYIYFKCVTNYYETRVTSLFSQQVVDEVHEGGSLYCLKGRMIGGAVVTLILAKQYAANKSQICAKLDVDLYSPINHSTNLYLLVCFTYYTNTLRVLQYAKRVEKYN